MKFRASQLLWVALAIGLLVWVVSQFGSGDARLIHQRLREVERLLAKPAGESQLIGANKVRQLGDLFMPQFEVHVEPYSETVTDRQELLRVALGHRSRSKSGGVHFSDVELEVLGNVAQMGAVAAVSGEGLSRESYRVAIEWKKSADDWLIQRINVLEMEGL